MKTLTEKLLALAEDADAKADNLAQLNAASGLDRDTVLAEMSFYRGQASGFRQSSYFMTICEGTEANA